MKKENGITLVALVVTIIILLILAGITISLTIGQDGIITKAQQAGQNMMLAQQYEQEQLNILNQEFSNIINGSNRDYSSSVQSSNFRKLIAEAISTQGVTTSIEDSDETIIGNIDKILEARTQEGDATAEDIAEGKKAYVDGQLITGTNKISQSGTIYSEIVTVKNAGGNTTVTTPTKPKLIVFFCSGISAGMYSDGTYVEETSMNVSSSSGKIYLKVLDTGFMLYKPALEGTQNVTVWYLL